MTSSARQLVGVAIPTLGNLRAAVVAAGDFESGVNTLREAGFAGGEALHGAFESWLAESGDGTALGDLTVTKFGGLMSRFFRDAGWGEVAFSEEDSEGVAIVDIVNCWEGRNGHGSQGCHITTGLLASFFGRMAGSPIAVLETECCEGDPSRCRFLMGSSEMMNYRWEQMSPAPIGD